MIKSFIGNLQDLFKCVLKGRRSVQSILLIAISYLFFLGCVTPGASEKHIYYLHGRIVELQGRNAASDVYGPYLFDAILDSLSFSNTIVHGELRASHTDFQAFCTATADQIENLIKKGVEPQNISVVGASKGAVMAMQISDRLEYPINYVLLGANTDQLERENDWHLHGRVLGIYERSDSLAGKNYQYWIDRSSDALRFSQVEIATGLGHGFLYQPLQIWLDPLKAWVSI